MPDARDRYLDTHYPLTSTKCVLSDGLVVMPSEVRGFFAVSRDGVRIGDVAFEDWRNLVTTGADFDKLKSFMAGVCGE